MSTVHELKVFKNGGSNAIRIPANIKLEGDVLFLEVSDADGDMKLHRKKPTKLQKFFELVERDGFVEAPFERDARAYEPREFMNKKR